MRTRSRLTRAVALLAACLPLAAAAHAAAAAADGPGAGTAGAAAKRPAPSTAVGVSAREFRLTPYRPSAPAGEIRFNVTNFGEDAHDLVVRTPGGRTIARSSEVRAGGRTVLRAKLRAGRYRLVCAVANHEQLGMTAGFAVSRPRRRAR